MHLNQVMAKYVRVGVTGGFYFVCHQEQNKIEEFFHLKQYDINQNIYGVPQYLSGLLSAKLNEAATLFRVKYYINGSHAGFILSVNGEVSNTSMEAIAQQLKDSKGSNNFKNMLIHLPKGDKDSVQLIPISEIAAKDEFINIKNASRDDILAIHRVPLSLMSIPPTNAAGYGDPAEHAKVFYTNEILPLVRQLEALNAQMGVDAFIFDQYTLDEKTQDILR